MLHSEHPSTCVHPMFSWSRGAKTLPWEVVPDELFSEKPRFFLTGVLKTARTTNYDMSWCIMGAALSSSAFIHPMNWGMPKHYLLKWDQLVCWETQITSFSIGALYSVLKTAGTTNYDASWCIMGAALGAQRSAAEHPSTRVHPMFSCRQNTQSFSSSLGNKTTLY